MRAFKFIVFQVPCGMQGEVAKRILRDLGCTLAAALSDPGVRVQFWALARPDSESQRQIGRQRIESPQAKAFQRREQDEEEPPCVWCHSKDQGMGRRDGESEGAFERRKKKFRFYSEVEKEDFF